MGHSQGHQQQNIFELFETLERLTFVDIATGSDHVLALTDRGQVFAWGNGAQNQLGRRIIERRKTNSLLAEPMGLSNIVKISSGAYHSFAVDIEGRVLAWGLNNFRQCGLDGQEAKQDIV